MEALHPGVSFLEVQDTSVNDVTAPSVLPKNIYVSKVGSNVPIGAVTGRGVAESYEEAVAECESKVKQIVAECKRMNQKYSDSHFGKNSF